MPDFLQRLCTTISPITILIGIVLILVIVLYKDHGKFQSLLCILLINFICEVIVLSMIMNKGDFSGVYNYYYILHGLFWLYQIAAVFSNRILKHVLGAYLLFAVVNLFAIEMSGLNYLTFIIGALTYLVLYLLRHFKLLRNENLSYFKSSSFIFLSAPVAFFFAMSFVLSFRESGLRHLTISGYSLYKYLVFSSSVIYYSLLAIYAVKLKKQLADG